MSEFEKTAELEMNPYDSLIEPAAEPASEPVILKGSSGAQQNIKPERAVEIIPLSSEVIYSKVDAKEYLDSHVMEFEIEEDLLVPDTEPDMEAILNASGRVDAITVYGEEGGTPEIRGTVQLETMYRAAGVYNNTISVIGTAVQFKKNPGEPGMDASQVTARAEIRKIEHHIINERKYRVKLHMQVFVREAKEHERHMFSGIEGEELYMKKETVRFASAVSKKTRESEISEEMLINDEKIRPLKIMKASFTVAENHRQLTKEKLIINETVWVRILYMAEIASKGNLSGQPMLFLGKIDHTQFVVLGKSEDEAAACIARSDAGGLRAEINSEATGFRIEGDISTDIELYSFHEKEVVTDFYHGREEMTCDRREETICSGIENLRMEQTIRESIGLPQDSGEELRVIYMDAAVTESSVEVTASGAEVRGKVQLEAVIMNEGDYTILAKKICDFSCSANLPAAARALDLQTCTVIPEAAIESVAVREMTGDIIGGNQVSITAQLQVQLNVHNEARLSCISNPCFIRSEDPVKQYPITVYTVKEDDSVWDIAKRFRVPEEYIMEINDPENVRPGRKIVIVK